MDCPDSMAAAHSAGKSRRPAALSRTLAGRICLLAVRHSLAPLAALDNILRLAGPFVLSGLLPAGLHWTYAHRSSSTWHFDHPGRASRLDRPGASTRAFAQRLYDGKPVAHADLLASG